MQRIIAPVTRRSNPDAVANLQNALRVFLGSGVYQLSGDDRAGLREALGDERNRGGYGDGTLKLVDAFQRQRGLEPTGEVDEPTADVMNALLRELGVLETMEEPEESGWSVRGWVVGPNGAARDRVTVRVYDRDLFFGRPFGLDGGGGAGQLLGQSITGPDGGFEIPFDPAAFASTDGSRTTPDVVFVVGADDDTTTVAITRLPDGRELTREVELTEEELLLGIRVRPAEVVKITMDAEQARSLSEYEIIWRTIARMLPRDDERDPETRAHAAAVRLDENSHRDITFLVRQTRLPRELITRFVDSCRLASRIADAAVPVVALYGLARGAGLTDLRHLGASSVTVLDDALADAADEGIIPVLDQPVRTATVEAIRRMAPALALESQPWASRFTLHDALAVAVGDPALRADLMRLAADHPGDGFWERVRANPELAQYADAVRYATELAGLVAGDIPLVRALQSAVPEATSLRSLTFHLDDDVLTQLVNDPAVTVPESTPGRDDKERRAFFAQGVAALLRNAYPTAAVAKLVGRLAGNAADASPVSPATARFLARVAVERADLELATGRLTEATDLLEGPDEEKAAVLAEAQRVQRLFRISTGEENLIGLLRSGFSSAYAITRTVTQQGFTTAFAATLGGQAQAALTYRRALGVSAANLVLATHAHQLAHGTTFAAVSGTLAEPPAWARLFTDVADCECGHCRSLLSPAAYFVDLLLFLDRHHLPSADKTPLQVLLARRPDLAYLRLSCENTNATLPYIDVVNEVLETYAVTGSTAKAAHDLATDPAELGRISAEADSLLANAVYPPTLPFDRWARLTRSGLEELGTSRAALLELFADGYGDAADAKRRERDAEYLGMTDRDWQVLTGQNLAGTPVTVHTPELYGLTDAEFAAADANDLLARLRMSPAEVAALSRCRYVDSTPEGVGGAAGREQHARRMVLFVRLWRAMGWTLGEVDTALGVLGVGGAAGITPAVLGMLAKVSRARRETGVEIARLLELWAKPSVDAAAEILGIPVAELDEVRELGALPTPADPAALFELGTLVRQVRQTGFTLPVLQYLYGVEQPGPQAIAPSRAEIAALVTALWTDVVPVTGEPAFPAADLDRSRALITRMVTDFLSVRVPGTDAGLVRALLEDNDLSPTPLGEDNGMSVLLKLVDVSAPPAPSETVVALLTGLHRVALLVAQASLTVPELRHMRGHSAHFGGFDLAGFATTPNPAGFTAWRRVMAYVSVRDRLVTGSRTLIEVFAAHDNQRATVLDQVTGWSASTISEAMTAAGIRPSALADDRAIAALERIITSSRALGLSPARLKEWAAGAPDRSQAEAIAFVNDNRHAQAEPLVGQASALAASPTAESPVRRSSRDAAREAERDALVSYVLAMPAIREAGLVTPDDLFDYFLIDVGMGAQAVTSRITQAISSVQLFTQRCLLNAEAPAVTPDAIDADQWEWRKSHRVAELNRSVFLHPENTLSPELRHDKSPFFRELEAELLDSEVTEDIVTSAMAAYLEKLETVANLEVSGFHWQRDAGTDVLHVLGRTRAGVPRQYFYRRFVDGREWTPWEPVGLDIDGLERNGDNSNSGVHLLPVVWRDKLYLFWTQFVRKYRQPDASARGAGDRLEPAEAYWEIRISWSRYEQGRWLPARTSTDFAEYPRAAIVPGRVAAAPATEFLSPVTDIAVLEASGAGQVGDMPRHFRLRSASDGSDLRIELRGADERIEMILEQPTSNPRMIHGGDVWATGLEVASSSDQFQRQRIEGALELASASRGMPISRLLGAHQGTTDITMPTQHDLDPLGGAVFLQNPYHNYVVNLYEDRVQAWPHLHHVPPTVPASLTLSGLVERIGRGGLGLTEPRAPRSREAAVQMSPWRGAAEALLPDAIATAAIAAQVVPSTRVVAPVVQLRSTATLYGETGNTATRIAAALPDALRDALVEPLVIPAAPGDPTVRARFTTFFHPYVGMFAHRLKRDGVSGLLTLDTQCLDEGADAFARSYWPVARRVLPEHPRHDVDFAPDGAYSTYNWELFFHLPILMAVRLSRHQRFAEAQKWFHRVFNPTVDAPLAEADDTPQQRSRRFWQVKPLRETRPEQLEAIFGALAAGADPVAGQRFVSQVEGVVGSPVEPHRLAGLRQDAYQKFVVMAYLDNVIAWADQLFRQDTIASVNEASQLYSLAAKLLGGRPDTSRRSVGAARSFAELWQLLDAADSGMAELENQVPVASLSAADPRVDSGMAALLGMGGGLYFSFPDNAKMLGYWDMLDDRLFKIRNGLTFEGVTRELPVSDMTGMVPALARTTVASPHTIDVIGELSTPLPGQRFAVVHAKAVGMCAEVRAYGTALLAALEIAEVSEREACALYLQAYQLAYDLAQQAERCYRFELGIAESSFIHLGYWDNLRTGLLAGESLGLALRQLERAYQEREQREYEITRHVSLRQLDPRQLLELRTTGRCEFELPESLFDLDFPGHYFRRIISVAVSVPCVAGPYTTINGVLTMLDNRLRAKPGVAEQYAEQPNDPRFTRDFVPVRSVAASEPLDDTGVFELRFSDERYLPFEGAGAISRWRFELTDVFRQFDYDTIPDLVLHVRYTARDGGALLRGKAVESVTARLGGAAGQMVRMFSLRHDFPDAWRQLTREIDGDTRTVTLPVDKARFPYFAARHDVTVTKVGLFLHGAEAGGDGAGMEFEPEVPAVADGGSWKLTVPARLLSGDRPAPDVIVLCDYQVALRGLATSAAVEARVN